MAVTVTVFLEKVSFFMVLEKLHFEKNLGGGNGL
jgi:hypothetical protein